MKWQKQGLIFSPANGPAWTKTHSQVPTPLVGDEFIRIYYSSRPQANLSLTTFVDLDIHNPEKVLRINEDPILPLGKVGNFDEHGIMPSCAVTAGKTVMLYYSGWSRGVSVPYTNATGLALSEDGGETFSKLSDGPILARGRHDPYSATSPCVLKQDDMWHMWYCSGTGWLDINGKLEHTYDIKHATSSDGLEWSTSGDVAIGQRTNYEALTRPFVIKRADGFHMWFCYRGSHNFRDGDDAYRIGYAFSDDLQNWQRDDDRAGITPSDEGWDSKMLAYPGVAKVKDRTLMFYNGNGFGVDGFGYATLVECA